MPPINLTGLRPDEYEHTEDRAALAALKKTGGLKILVEKISAWGTERLLRIQLTGSFIRVTPDGYPEIWKLYCAAKERLSLPVAPDLYIRNAGEINAFTAGVLKPIIVINSGTVDSLEDDELLFVIAHEMGHIKSGHVLYYQIAEFIPAFGNLLGDVTLGIGNILSVGLQVALLHWQRTSELTADRAGLLACQDGEKAMRALMKLAGLPHKYAARCNVEEFISQARQFESFDISTADKVAKYLSIYGSSHPWTVMRAKELLNWMDSGGYATVLNRPRPKLGPAGEIIRRFCEQCGHEAASLDIFCANCGHRLLAVQ